MASTSRTKQMISEPTRTVDELQNEENIVDGEIVPSSLSSIVPILRAANEIEEENPRVAYLCELFFQLLLTFFVFVLFNYLYECRFP